MSGNLQINTSIFQQKLQEKINSVNSQTTTEEIISYLRAGELLSGIDNTPLQIEIQQRMNDVGTDFQEYLELSVAYGKITNEIYKSRPYYPRWFSGLIEDATPSSAGEILRLESAGRRVRLEYLGTYTYSSAAGVDLIVDGETVVAGNAFTLVGVNSNYRDTYMVNQSGVKTFTDGTALTNTQGSSNILTDIVGDSIVLNKSGNQTPSSIYYSWSHD